MTVNITGTAISPDGDVKPGAIITLRTARLDVVSQDGNFVIPDDIIATTAIDGTVDFDILPGQYVARTIAVGNRSVKFSFNVADVASADFADCVGAAWIPVPPDSVTVAQDARDEAVAAASQATAASSQIVYPEQFGAVGDGVTDDTAELQAAIDYVYALGGGAVRLSGGKKYLIDSADLLVRDDTLISGNGWGGGQRVLSDYTDIPGLIVNSSRTIRMLRNSGLVGIAIRRKGLTAPNSYRTAIQAVANYAGTAITLGTGAFNSGADAKISDVFCIGFAQFINATNVERYLIENVRGDNLSGIKCDGGTDTMQIRGVHFWPFLNAHQPWSINGYSITGAANNGSGLIRITCVGHPFITGDIARVNGITGTTEAHGRWTVTVINANTFDLQGSTFANSYVSGGTAYAWAGSRSGTGIEISGCDGAHIQGAVVYGYDKGFHITGGSNATILSHCVTDYNPAWGDNVSIGILCDDESFNTRFFGGFVNGSGYGIRLNSTRGEASSLYGMAVSAVVRAVDLIVGSVIVDGCNISGNCNVGTGATSFRVIGSDTFNASFTGDNYTAATKFVFVGDRYNTSLARLGGTQVDLGLSESGQPNGMRSRLQIASSSDIRAKRRTDAIGGAIAFEKPDGNLGHRIGHIGETELVITPVLGEASSIILGPRSPTAGAVNSTLIMRANASPAATSEFYSVSFRDNDSSLASISYAGIAATSTDVTAGAAKGSLHLRARAGASGLQNTLTLTGDHVVQHGPSQRTVIDTNSHIRLRSYTVATLPSASPAAQQIYVSDLVGGAEPCFSDGTNWRRGSDRTIAN